MHHRLAALTSLVGLAVASHAVAQSCEWEFFETPTITDGFHYVFGMDGLADNDVWAVGSATEPDFDTITFAMHFDGLSWTPSATPNPSQIFGVNKLENVLAFASDDVLAVGAFNPDTGGPSQTLAMRFDGSSWQVIASPVIEGGSSFFGIDRIGSDVWVVGIKNWNEPPPAASSIALATRWTGTEFREEFVPPLAALGGRSSNSLFAVDGVTPNDVWGVGWAQQRGTDNPFGPRTYMVHWSGAQWDLVEFDIGHIAFSGLHDVVAIAADDVYAVGWTLTDNNGTQPLIAHYDGSAWTQVALPLFDGRGAELLAVVARAHNDVYAFGTTSDDNGTPRDLILRYDGTSWAQMPAAAGHEQEWFRAAALLPSGQIWATGQYSEPGVGISPLAERLDCTPGCPADLDGNGVVNTQDFLLYLGAFAAGDPLADWNNDGQINTLDFLEYLGDWAAGWAGCP